MKRPKKKQDPFEYRYPTERARDVADVAFDALPMTATLAEACRVWETSYLDANGTIRPVRK